MKSNRFSRAFVALLLTLVLSTAWCTAEGKSVLTLQNEDDAPFSATQEKLQSYLDKTNDVLSQHGSRQINSLYDCRGSFCVVGISDNGGEIPDDMSGQLPCEITFRMSDDGIMWAEVHSSQLSGFSGLCAALISAASESVTYDDAFAAADVYTQKALADPSSSFGSDADTTQGDSLRCYYSYFPDQYMDGSNWIQLTMVFPLEGYSGVALTPPPTSSVRYQGDAASDYEGYSFDGSDYHYETFTSPTPEPEIDFSQK